tara:strand:+ start:804 stop:1175 length:372 start_codon:yes stop_codon:yes gene_type:complete
MKNKLLSQFNKADLEAKLKGDQVSKLNTGGRPGVLHIPSVTVYKGGRSRGGSINMLAYQSSKKSDLNILIHEAMRREFRGNLRLYKNSTGVDPGKNGATQGGLRKTANENFKKATKNRILDSV